MSEQSPPVQGSASPNDSVRVTAPTPNHEGVSGTHTARLFDDDVGASAQATRPPPDHGPGTTQKTSPPEITTHPRKTASGNTRIDDRSCAGWRENKTFAPVVISTLPLSFRPLGEISFPPHEPQPSRASQEISPFTRNDRGEPLIAHLE